MTYSQHVHRREAYGVRGSSTHRGNSVCQGAMSRGEGTRMASNQAVTTRATSTPAAHGPAPCAPAHYAARASGGRGLKRAALYARVSTDKQKREETVVSQVDLLYQTAAAYHYMRFCRAPCSSTTASVGRASIGRPWSAYGIWWPKASLRCCWSRPLTDWPAAMPIKWC
jgi:hypothetical protein